MKILLLTGGNSGEREVSIRSGKTITEALSELKYDFVVADPADDKFEINSFANDFDLAFLAMHGHGAEDGTIQEQLDEAGLPYASSGVAASELCFDKWAYKNLLSKHGILTPNGQMVSLQNFDEKLLDKPYVLKPNKDGSSLYTQIVRKPNEQTKKYSLELLSKHDEMLLETLIEGSEITVGVLEDEALPVIEIIPPTGLEFDYANKYNGLTQELCPPKNVSEKLQHEAQDLALKIHKLTGCKYMSRTDIMIDTNDQLYVLETNTIPGLTAQSLYPKMIKQSGKSIAEFVDQLLKSAISQSH